MNAAPEAATAAPTAVSPGEKERRAGARFWLRALAEDAPFLVVVIVYTAAAFLLSAVVDVPEDFSLRISLRLWYVVTVATVLFGVAMILGVMVREVRSGVGGLRHASSWRRAARQTFPKYETVRYAFAFALLPFLAETFIAFKAEITNVLAFGPWDVRFEAWDRMLHLGTHPWELLQPLLGYAPVTYALDFVYYLWFPVLWMTVTWQAWHGSRDSSIRLQFLLAFALGWVLLGSAAAIAFSSAGPVYFASVTSGPDIYAGLLDYLRSVDSRWPLKALWTHDTLWTLYEEGRLRELGGISAMPSLHVAMATLLALFGWRVNRAAGVAYTIFALLIFLGSIHLAWHYAIDGYAGAAGMALIWWASGRAARWWRRVDPMAGTRA